MPCVTWEQQYLTEQASTLVLSRGYWVMRTEQQQKSIYIQLMNPNGKQSRFLMKLKKSPTESPTVAPNKKTGNHQYTDNHLFFHINLARLAGVEPATYGFVVRTPEFSNLLNLLKLLENLFFILADFPYIPRFSSFWRKSHILIHIPKAKKSSVFCF